MLDIQNKQLLLVLHVGSNLIEGSLHIRYQSSHFLLLVSESFLDGICFQRGSALDMSGCLLHFITFHFFFETGHALLNCPNIPQELLLKLLALHQLLVGAFKERDIYEDGSGCGRHFRLEGRVQ